MQEQFKDIHIQNNDIYCREVFFVAETSERIHKNIREGSVNEFCNLYLLQVKMPK